MRVGFAGTPEFSVPSLKALIDSPLCDVVAVYCRPDRPAGRGRKVSAGAVRQCGLDHGLPVFQPQSFRQPGVIDQMAALELDLLVVVAYSLLLPVMVLNLPVLGCVNLHASLLPRWRGAAPIQRAIEAGDSHSGISLMQMSAGLDAGDILSARQVDIPPDGAAGWLHDRLSALAADVLAENLRGLKDRTLAPVAQEQGRVTYADKVSKSESRVDWTRPAVTLARKIRAFNPWPMTSARFGDMDLRILKASVHNQTQIGRAGEIVGVSAAGIVVQTGAGALKLERVQKPGGKPVAVRDFINGIRVATGMMLA